MSRRPAQPPFWTTGYAGIIDGAGLTRSDPRLLLRRVTPSMSRKQAGQMLRRSDDREHVALHLEAFTTWHRRTIGQLRFTSREPMPRAVRRETDR